MQTLLAIYRIIVYVASKQVCFIQWQNWLVKASIYEEYFIKWNFALECAQLFLHKILVATIVELSISLSNIIVYIYSVCVYVCLHLHTYNYTCRDWKKVCRSLFSFYFVVLNVWTWAICLGDKQFNLLSHLISSNSSLFTCDLITGKK